jgi:hypothetical protein
MQRSSQSPLRHLEPNFSRRVALLEEVLYFVRGARVLESVRRIALIGSLATSKTEPKDCDLLVVISDDIPLGPLAALSRRLKGRTGSLGSGADVFLSDPGGRYLGRICEWRECWRRVRCDALNCGLRPHLHDDLQTISLSRDLIAVPPVELWPEPSARGEVPSDVMRLLLDPLRADQTTADEH